MNTDYGNSDHPMPNKPKGKYNKPKADKLVYSDALERERNAIKQIIELENTVGMLRTRIFELESRIKQGTDISLYPSVLEPNAEVDMTHEYKFDYLRVRGLLPEMVTSEYCTVDFTRRVTKSQTCEDLEKEFSKDHEPIADKVYLSKADRDACNAAIKTSKAQPHKQSLVLTPLFKGDVTKLVHKLIEGSMLHLRPIKENLIGTHFRSFTDGSDFIFHVDSEDNFNLSNVIKFAQTQLAKEDIEHDIYQVGLKFKEGFDTSNIELMLESGVTILADRNIVTLVNELSPETQKSLDELSGWYKINTTLK
ncbi:hypothetical protein [Vibrio harveyi]|uniref:hypothetical protein n=1 Tax=Vibrio harveyi TaxID=669 RepID=UPI00390B15EF